jgi:tetratricopeptide (TPR) repeat protein
MRKLTFSLLIMAAVAGCKSGGNDDVGTGVPLDAKVEPAVVVNPGASAHVAAAELALSQNNIAEAITQYNAALAKDPDNQKALYNLGTLYVYQRQFDQAISAWDRYVRVTANNATAWSNLGRAHELAGHWKEAEINYLRAIERDPQNKTARVNYGILLAKRDRVDEATKQLSAVLVPAEVHYNLGSVYELKKNYVKAKESFEKALSFDPELTVARQRLEQLQSVTAAE